MAQCVVCGQRASGNVAFVGPICGPACKLKVEARNEEARKVMLAEDMWSCPEEMDIREFEKFMFKLAVHFIEKAPETIKDQWRRESPDCLKPFPVYMEVKARVIRSIPMMYVSAMKTDDPQAGVYQFKKKVPKSVVLDALVKSKVLKERPV
jgi:hypothetical protein